jgi:23S rRNA pseudouridine1911/1915/1917 synthase
VTLLRFVLGPEVERERIDKVLARLCPGTSRATLQRWMEDGLVRVDGNPCRPSDRARVGSVVEVQPGSAPPSAAAPDPGVRFSVLYEDDELIVVDKPAGLVVHPARGHWQGTLVNGLLARPGFERAGSDARDPAGALRPGIVHRIDKDTSGVLVVAKTETAREHLKSQLARHSVERRYLAITVGTPEPGTIRTAYGRDPRSRIRFTSRVREGKTAITEIGVLERFRGGRAALVECRLRTGRTHQIRVHLSERAGTPLLADTLYSRGAVPAELEPIQGALGRQALHASVLGFQHPRTEETLRFETPLPKDMQQAIESLRA